MKRHSYPSDLSDEQCKRIERLLPAPKPGGRPAQHDRLAILNAILYLVRTGCAWRLLPHDMPSWKTVYHYFRCWRLDGTWKRIHDQLRGDVRQAAGRNRQPSAAHGYDAGKKINGRKRHLLVDVLGLVLVAVVHPADIQDRDGAKLVLALTRHTFLRLRLIWADGGYAGQLLDWVRNLRQRNRLKMEIVKRTDDVKGFKVLPRRWVVERTFGWLGRHRRFSKDYEYLPASSEALIYIAMISIMVRRLAPS
ncbi:MAG: IS5 family transposase [Polyangia bacterium]